MSVKTSWFKTIGQWVQQNVLLLLFLLGLTLVVFIPNIPTFPALTLKDSINLVELLGGTIVIIVVVERSVELFINAWRNPRKEELQKQIESIKNQGQESIELLTEEEETQFVQTNKIIKDLETKQNRKLDQHIRKTQLYSLWLSLFFGVMAAIAGIRILEPLVDLTGLSETDSLQLKAFYRLDLVLSAIAISTGSQLFHIFPSLVSDVLNGTRARVNPNGENAGE